MMIAALIILSLLLLVLLFCDYCLYGRVKKIADSNKNLIRIDENDTDNSLYIEGEWEYFGDCLKIVNNAFDYLETRKRRINMGELKIDEILNMGLIDKKTGEVVMTYPVAKVGVNKNKTCISEELFEQMSDSEFALDDWGRWHQDTVDWLLKPLDVGDIEIRSEDDEVWKDKRKI